MVGLLPVGMQQRLRDQMGDFHVRRRPRFVAILGSIALGIATHLVWDSFTHSFTWPWHHSAGCSGWVHCRSSACMPIYSALQYGSTVAGLLALAIWVLLWYRKTPGQDDAPAISHPQSRASRWPLAMFVVAAVGRTCPRLCSWSGMPACRSNASTAFLLIFGVTALALAFWQLAALLCAGFVHQVLDHHLMPRLMPLVSVIMNVRNGAATLREAIDSVMAQTLHRLGADRLGRPFHRRQREHRRRVPRSANPLLPLARRYAARAAPETMPCARRRGEWLAFLDQDDVWLPHKLEKQMALADEGVGLIYGRTVRFYPGGLERDYDQAHEYELAAGRRHLHPAVHRSPASSP